MRLDQVQLAGDGGAPGHLVEDITSQAGLVTVPRHEAQQLRQVEFLPLSGDRVLVILVVNEREVQNRIIHTQRVFTEEQLRGMLRLVARLVRVEEVNGG